MEKFFASLRRWYVAVRVNQLNHDIKRLESTIAYRRGEIANIHGDITLDKQTKERVNHTHAVVIMGVERFIQDDKRRLTKLGYKPAKDG